MLLSAALVPPAGPEWLHEAKLDGFRAQVHVSDGDATIYSRNGLDLTRRFRSLRPMLEAIPVRSAIVDCELVACGNDGMPCFKTLVAVGNKAPGLFLWCFDLLYLNGVRLMPLPLTQRKEMLAEVIALADDEHIQFSADFPDPLALLAAGEKTGLEGVVSKRRDSAYRSGRTRDWLKIKTKTWREANRERFSMLHKKPRVRL